MKIERISQFKAELLSKSSKEWGEILFRLALEAAQAPVDTGDLRREYEILKMKFSVAISALEPYAQYETYTGGQSVQQLTLSAKVALEKIERVDWLATKGASPAPESPR